MMPENYNRRYRQTLLLGLIKVIKELFPEEKLKIPYSILDAVYCEFPGSLISPREVNVIEQALHEWVQHKSRIEFTEKRNGFYIYKLDANVIKTVYPAFDDTSKIKGFKLYSFAPGFILDFADEAEAPEIFPHPEKLSAAYAESEKWLEVLDLSDVEDVNAYIRNGRAQEIISLAEALQEKKVSDIADMINVDRKRIRIVLISGPSSSGKTTFTRRLSTQLTVNGLKPISLSLDNYFLDRDKTPRDAKGQPDFDTLYALDLSLLNDHLERLVAGEAIETPVFNFITGNKNPHGQIMCLEPHNILLVEGIHALNPSLLTISKNFFFKIYVSALFSLNINNLNRVPTTDARLIRRMVRDEKFRAFHPERTLNQWASVRRGEKNSVFKYQEEADVMFNSSLLFELNALRSYAEPLLETVPKNSDNYDAALRLLNLLSFFEPMDTTNIPFNSILREFIGGSIYPV